MKVAIRFSITIGKDQPKRDDDITIDRVGTHHDIPPATYDNGFMPNDDDRRNR